MYSLSTTDDFHTAMRKPSLTNRVLEGLVVLATNPCAAEQLTEIQRYNINKEDLEKARVAYDWISKTKKYKENKGLPTDIIVG